MRMKSQCLLYPSDEPLQTSCITSSTSEDS